MSSFTFWMIFINTSFWLIVCFGMAYFVRIFPKEWYEKNLWFFKEYPFERQLYKNIGVGSWKDKLPEWGKVMKFEKRNLRKELTLEYVDRFILETYYAEVGHVGMAILGFACILINPNDYALMAIICSFVNLIVQLPFCLIQRYNRPRLLKIKSRLENKNSKLNKQLI